MSAARALLLTLALAACVAPASARAATATVVPMTLANNHVYVDVEIDGTGPYHFVIDSGAPFGLLDRELARRLGLTVRDAGTIGGVGDAAPAAGRATVTSLSVGGRALRDRSFVVTPLRDTIGRAEGREIDGILGSDLLRESVVTIDYARGLVTLDADVDAERRAGASVVRLDASADLPQIACRVANVAGTCTVDTGSRLSATIPASFVARHPDVAPARATEPGIDGYGIGGAATGRIGRLASLAFGGFDLRDVICDYSAQKTGAFANPRIAANLGGGVWRRFALTFDLPHGELALRPTAAFGEPERFDRSGLFVGADARDAIVVLDVRPGTPAAEVGLAPGDTLVARDGTSLGAHDLPDLRDALADPARAEATLRVERDGTSRDVRLPLRDFVDEPAVRPAAHR